MPPATQASLSKFGEGDEMDEIVEWIPIIGQTAVWWPIACEILALASRNSSTSIPGTVPMLLTFGTPSKAHEINISTPFIFGWLLLIISGSLRLLCYHQLGPQYTYRLSIIDDHRLITTGLYAIIRHPSYSTWIAFITGVLIMQMSPGSWLIECGVSESLIGRVLLAAWVVYNAFLVSRIPARARREDDAMKREFGAQWLQYSRQTRYKLLPGVY